MSDAISTSDATSTDLNAPCGSEAVMRPLYEAKIKAADALFAHTKASPDYHVATLDERVDWEREHDALVLAFASAMSAIATARVKVAA